MAGNSFHGLDHVGIGNSTLPDLEDHHFPATFRVWGKRFWMGPVSKQKQKYQDKETHLNDYGSFHLAPRHLNKGCHILFIFVVYAGL